MGAQGADHVGLFLLYGPLEQDQRIARPRQLYIGPAARDYVPAARRG
jgi:hypothetical protein